MIEIPEITIFDALCTQLRDDLPSRLLEIEENSGEGIRLPPFRYVGDPETVPSGVRPPYALVTLKEGSYTTKDRILKNRIFNVEITLKVDSKRQLYAYCAALKEAVHASTTEWKIGDLRYSAETGKIDFLVKM